MPILTYLPDHDHVLNPSTGKRLLVIRDPTDPSVGYVSVYGLASLLQVDRLLATRFRAERFLLCHVVQPNNKARGRPTICVKLSDLARFEGFVEDERARGGDALVRPCPPLEPLPPATT